VTSNERGGWVTVRSGKGRKQRRVPIHAKAREVLQEYLDTWSPESAGEPLFLSQKGGGMMPYAIWYTAKKYAEQASVVDVSPHTFRHTVATRYDGTILAAKRG
jgi:integrase/recombinase XerD